MQTIDMVSYRDSSPMMGMSMEDSLTSLTSANSFSTINNGSFSGSDLDHAEHYNQEKQKQVQRLAKGQAAHNMRQLPEDYVLSEYDVICGRGRRCFNHIGNQRFRKIVADSLPKYSDASAKLEKTIIICDVVNTVRGNSPNGGFVKKDPATGRYFEVGDFLAREKTSQAFRDALADQYKSSTSTKKKRRLKDSPVKLYKQLSAPLLSASAIRESGEDRMMLGQNSARSARNHPHTTFSAEDYAVNNNSKFMRVEPSMDLLLGELDTALSLSFNGKSERSMLGKRNVFASQKSLTSVSSIDKVQATEGVPSSTTPAWFNRSCPDFSYNTADASSSGMNTHNGMECCGGAPLSSMLNQVQEVVGEEDEESLDAEQFSYPTMYDNWHHSTPNLFSSTETMNFNKLSPPSSSSSSSRPRFATRPNLLALSPNKKRSQSVRHFNMGGGSSFSVYHSPEKTSSGKGSVSHEDIVLSPIGDGKTEDLFVKLQNIAEFSESANEEEAAVREEIQIPF